MLILNELGLWSPGVAAINKEIFSALEKSPYQIEFYSEDLDSSLFPDEATQREFFEWYLHKYRDRKPDLIIAVGPSPIKLMSDSHELLSPGTPIVFWGSTEEFAEPPKLDSHFTGVWGIARPGRTLEAALRLAPNTKHVVVVGGVAPYDRYLEGLVKQRFRSYGSTLDFTYLTDLAMPELLERLKHLPSNTIVYHTSIMEDTAGKHFIDALQSVPLVTSSANAPVFSVDDVDVGTGAVGGDVFSYSLAGQVVGSMAVRILNGERPQDIPIIRGSNIYMFDWRAVKRWGLKASEIPPGSIILNREPTAWELYKWYILGGIVLILLETLLIGALLWQRMRRRTAENELRISNDRLHRAVEAGKCVGWDWDKNTGRNHCFGDLQTVFGIESDSYAEQAEDFRRLVFPEDLELVEQAIMDAERDRKPYDAEFRVVRADGAVHWVSARGKFDGAGNGDLRMFGMAADVTDLKKAEEARRQKEAELEKTQKLAKVGGWRWDPETDSVSWSEELYRIAGLDPTQPAPSYKEHPKLYTTESWERLSRAVEESLRTGSEYKLDLEMTRPDGTTRWVIGRGEAISDDNGRIVQLHGMVQDITDRKRAEQELQASEERLAGIVGSAMDAIIAVDEERRIVLFNAAAEKIFGCAQDEAVGTLIDRFIPERFRSEHGAYMRRFAEFGSASRAMGTSSALWAIRSNGHEFPMEASIARIESQGRGLFTVTIRDITERRRAEEAIRESEQRFRLVANTAPVMIWMSDIGKLFNYFNQPWLEFTGCSSEAELRKSWAKMVHPEDLDAYLDIYRTAFVRRESFRLEYRVRRHDGEYRWILDHGVPRFDSDGTFAGYIGSCIDVTVRKLADDALATVGRRLIEAHEEERTWIARELHDDIIQRLAVLAYQLDQWGTEDSSNSPLPGHLLDLQEQIAGIAADTQTISHRLHSSRLDFLGLAIAARSYCKELSEKAKVEIDFNNADMPSTLPKEVSLCLFRVMQEALQNAVKHSGVQTFKVELSGTPDSVELKVADSGRGFEGQEALSCRGLGLVSMRERLQIVHGELKVQSKPGAGTTIYARVPLKTPENHVTASSENQSQVLKEL
ncbi:MAG: PAS domain S-box protein [Terracidiphilus sp.]